MRDTATNSQRPQRRSGGTLLGGMLGAFLALQITVLMLMPPHVRGITAGLLTMVTIVALIVVAMEVGFKRAAERAAEATARAAEPPPRRPRGQVSPLIQRAYRLARSGASASHIARSCEVPEAFAVLIIDDVRRTASRKGRAGRAARNSSGRTYSDGRRPKNPPAI